jgi:hypothetical protein
MMQISGMVRRAFTTSSGSAPPESVQATDSMTDSSRDSVEASNMSTPALADSNAVSTAPSEPEASKEPELSHEAIARSIEASLMDMDIPDDGARTPPEVSLGQTPISPGSDRRRSGRERRAIATYNASILSGNAVHTRRAFRTYEEYSLAQVSRNTAKIAKINENGEWVDVSGNVISDDKATPAKSIERSGSSKRRSFRKSGRLEQKITVTSITTRLFATKKKTGLSDAARSLRPRKRLASEEPEESTPAKKARVSEEPEVKADKPVEPEKKRVKQWLASGLYAGQSRLDSRRKSSGKKPLYERQHLPLPMFTGQLMLERGRVFTLPFDILNPLPKSQAPAWTNLKKSKSKAGLIVANPYRSLCWRCTSNMEEERPFYPVHLQLFQGDQM